MSGGDRVDIAHVAPRPRAQIRANTAANRRLALAALCVCACTLASVALGSPADASKRASSASSHTSAPAKHRNADRRGHARKIGCARRSSFHASHGKPKRGSTRHAKRRPSCRRHHGKGRQLVHHGAKHQAAAHHAPASHSSSCPDADLRPTPANLEAVRAATLCLVNRERTGNGEVPLQADAHLQQAAQGHSEDMSSGDYFEHDGRHGDTPLDRMRSAGYIFSSHLGYEVGENIGWGTLWLASPRSMVASWMASPEHRTNILDGHFRDSGVGVAPHGLASLAKGQAGAIYTQDFGVIVG
jgi:uncharacterized protein YkwD